MRVAVVEDDEYSVGVLKEYINKFSEQNGQDIYVTVYKDGEQFITNYKSDADIIFMDIQMPYLDGYKASRMLRERDGKVKLVFVTNLSNYAIKGYDVDACGFLVKPISYILFESLMQKIVNQLQVSDADQKLTLHTTGGAVRIDWSDVVYIEVMNHTLIYHTLGKDIQLFGSLKECEKTCGDNFYRCAGSFIINLKYVTSYTPDTVTLAEKFTLPISRAKKREFKKVINDFIVGE